MLRPLWARRTRIRRAGRESVSSRFLQASEALECRIVLSATTLLDIEDSPHAGHAAVDVVNGVYTPEQIAAFESIPVDSSLSTKTPMAALDGSHEADILTFVLDFKEVGQNLTSDIFGNTISTLDVTSYGFASTDFDIIANAILAEVREDYFDELLNTVGHPPDQDLRVDFIIGDIGVVPAGVTEFYYIQIGTGVAGPHATVPGILGVAGGSVVRDSVGVGPNFGIATGDVVASIFTDHIVNLSGVGNALTSGDLTSTTNGIAGTLSHEAAHTVSLSHINTIASVQPTAGAFPIMGTGAIDLPNAARITDREFSISGVDGENANAPRMHIQQLVDAIGLHEIPAPEPEPPEPEPEPEITGTYYVVNTTSDSPADLAGVPDGLISLREAIIAANTNAAFGDAPAGMATADVISFDPDVFQGAAVTRTITMENGPYIITDDVRIIGVAGGVILDAGGDNRAFRIVSSQLTILQNLNIEDGVAPDLAGGGAIRITGGGRTILSRVIIDDASAEGRGGGILLVDSTLETYDVQIFSSTATNGGAFASINGIATLNRTLISGNNAASQGGGLSNDGGRLILRDSVVSFNTANTAPGVRGGGGIYNNGRLAVSNTEVFANAASNAHGGGIFSVNGGVTIGGATISQNTAAQSGGGITILAGELIMAGSRLGGPGAGAGNIAGINGGGLQNAGTASVLIEDCRVQFNEAGEEGGGLWNSQVGKLTVRGGAPPSVTSVIQNVELSASDLQATVDQYRGLLGVDNGGVPGSQTDGRREIDWDDAPDSVSTPNSLPVDFYNQALDPFARGLVLSTPGSGFQLSATAAANVGTLFSNLNPTYTLAFDTFSAERLMSPIGSNVTVIDFRIPGTDTPGLVDGFGAVFTDVDVAGATKIEYFDINGNLLLTRSAPAVDAQKSLSFLGATFSFPVVAQVRITTGTAPLGLKDVSGNGPVDVVVMDNFIFGEPVTVESVATNTNIRGNVAHGQFGNQGGGGIYNDGGSVAIFDVTISDNLADGNFGSGGGIFSRAGVVMLDEVTISGNDSARAGGGIELVNGQLTINDSLISGNETGLLPFGTPTPGNGGGLHVTANAFVRINGGSIEDNRAALEGGGLWNSSNGVMIVTDAEISGNSAHGDAGTDGGGGIFNFNGRLILDGATVSNNSADGSLGTGGGLFSQGGAVTITDTLFEGNSANRAGGGIELLTARAELTDTTLRQNRTGGVFAAPGNGGGLHMSGAGRVDIFGGLIEGNTASSEGGGLWNSSAGLMILHGGTAIRDNIARGADHTSGGGGIFNDGGRLAIARAELSGNSASGANSTGGAILSAAGITSIENSTISGNMATSAGGGIANFGMLVSVNNTIVLNSSNADGNRISAGGVFSELGAITTLRNTIVAGNLSETETRGIAMPSDLGGNGSWGASVFNLIGAAMSAGTLTDGVDGNIVGLQGSGVIPLSEILDSNLTDNGGPTRTHALTFSSRAVNTGNNNLARNSAGQLLTTDQRGPGFPRVFNSTVDIGAFER